LEDEGIRVARLLRKGELVAGRYKVDGLLGQGGMGAVYLVDDEKLPGKQWAMKQALPSMAGGSVTDALKEARVIMSLSHPQLPNIVDLVEEMETGSVFLVMDYIRGTSLEALFQENGRNLDVACIVRYAIQLGNVFAYLHSRRPSPIIYRDLKPDNVLIDERNQVRLIDFGTARSYIAGKRSDTMPIGTIGFAAPEQFESAQSDRRTDLFALGALIYYLLSGGKYYYAVRQPLMELRGDLPQPLTGLVDRLLRTNPNERIQTAEQVVKTLSVLMSALADGFAPSFGHLAESLSYPSPPAEVTAQKKPIILIGSLYPGAGATMIGTSLARELNRRQIAHAYIEYPGNPPDLCRLLYGEKHAPRHYRFCDDLIMRDTDPGAYRGWFDGLTEWVPASPDGSLRPWESNDNRKLLRLVDSPIMLIDVANLWREEPVRELCRLAAAIIVITDTNPGKMYRPQAARTIETLLDQQSRGTPLHLIANRDMPLKGRKLWLSSLFIPPICCFPELDSSRVVQCQWQGKLCADDSELGEAIRASFKPLLRALLPGLTRIISLRS
jgi:serine/threonine-protein kinase